METQAKAHLRYLHIAPRKTRAVVDVLRGLPVREAEAQLLLMPRRAATPLLKLLRSAAANAKQVMKKDADELFIKEIRVDQGPKSTRWMPRARGAMSPIERKTSHVSIVLGIAESPKPSRFVIKVPVKKREEEKKRSSAPHGHDHAHDHVHERPHEDKERGKTPEVRKEKGRSEITPREGGEKRGFMQRVFRRKAI
jgi:large subunit ribosomal protein L22